MEILSLLFCCFVFHGSISHPDTSINTHKCSRSVVYTKLSSSWFSADTYFVSPVLSLSGVNIQESICHDLLLNISLNQPFKPPRVSLFCDSAHVFDTKFGNISDWVFVQNRLSCLDSPKPVRITGPDVCLWSCMSKDGRDRPAVFRDYCDLTPHPLEYIDHSGFGSLVSRLLSGFFDVVMALVSTALSKMISFSCDLFLDTASRFVDVCSKFLLFEVVICYNLNRLIFPRILSIYMSILSWFVIHKLNFMFINYHGI